MITASPMSPEGYDVDFLAEERRAREEIEQFEELEKEFASTRRGIRVKFDDERIANIAQTTLLKTEPCFHINSTEDQVTKHFYQNETKQFSRQTSLRTPSEPDSLEEEEYLVTFQVNARHFIGEQIPVLFFSREIGYMMVIEKCIRK